MSSFFFFNDPATPEIYTLSLHDALPISSRPAGRTSTVSPRTRKWPRSKVMSLRSYCRLMRRDRSEEHTSELQSHSDLVCRLLLEKKKKTKKQTTTRQRQHPPTPPHTQRT